MTRQPNRVVDAHVHLWDPARTDWYPYLSGRHQLDMGDVTGMSRRFDVATYLAEADGWNVEKLVNVAAATGRHSVDETIFIDERADLDGHPDAIVGVPMSKDHTGTAQLQRLIDCGYRVAITAELDDVDDVDDAIAIAALVPSSRFAHAVSTAIGTAEPRPVN